MSLRVLRCLDITDMTDHLENFQETGIKFQRLHSYACFLFSQYNLLRGKEKSQKEHGLYISFSKKNKKIKCILGNYKVHNSYKLLFYFRINFSYNYFQNKVKIGSAFEYHQFELDWQNLDHSKLKRSYMKYLIDFDHCMKQILFYL